jgi:hypothetical protein
VLVLIEAQLEPHGRQSQGSVGRPLQPSRCIAVRDSRRPACRCRRRSRSSRFNSRPVSPTSRPTRMRSRSRSSCVATWRGARRSLRPAALRRTRGSASDRLRSSCPRSRHAGHERAAFGASTASLTGAWPIAVRSRPRSPARGGGGRAVPPSPVPTGSSSQELHGRVPEREVRALNQRRRPLLRVAQAVALVRSGIRTVTSLPCVGWSTIDSTRVSSSSC